jgi:hypothetical protein
VAELLVEPVEKVDLSRIRQVGRKYGLSGCSVCDDLVLGNGQMTPENTVLTRQKGFSYRLVILYFLP